MTERKHKWLGISRTAVTLVTVTVLIQGCVRLVSPYSADLQKRASDMIAEVTAWDAVMRGVSGPIPVKDVQATLAKWNGEVAAMAGIAASLDPGTVRCDRVAGKVMNGVAGLLPRDLKDDLPAAPASLSSRTNAPPQGCEATRFSAMADDIADLKVLLVKQCGLTALQDTPTPGTATSPTMTSNCRALFGGAVVGQSGPLVNDLLRDLAAVVYIEGRKKPPPAK